MDALLFVVCVAGASLWLLPAAGTTLPIRRRYAVIESRALVRALRRS